MKLSFNYRFSTNIFIVLLFALLFGACEKNDITIDSSADALFRPLSFSIGKVSATTAQINFNKVIEASTYEFEFALDESFSEIVTSNVILADTLTPFSTSTTSTKVQYRVLFEELLGSTQYYVRMKAWDKRHLLSSAYVVSDFETEIENLFDSRVVVSQSSAVLTWSPAAQVTHIQLTNILTFEQQNYPLNASQIETGILELSGLNMGTTYMAEIFKEEKIRGTITFSTTGLQGSELIQLDEMVDALDSLLMPFLEQGITKFTINFKNGTTFTNATAQLIIPAGVTSLILSASMEDESPTLIFDKIIFTTPVEEFIAENLNIQSFSGSSSASAELFYADNATNAARTYILRGCSIKGYRDVFRVKNQAIEIDKIEVDNCMVFDNGGYGFVNVGGNSVRLAELKVQKSTFVDLTTQFADIRTSVGVINITSCTFYNQKVGLTHFFRFANANQENMPGSLTTENLILSGPNNSVQAAAIYSDYALLSSDFGTCFRTTDFQETSRTSRIFTGINIFLGTSTDLFVSTESYDFHIKTGSGFAGEGICGDPRWF